jgi:hypothetical protein
MQVGDDPHAYEFGAPFDDVRIARLVDPWFWLPENAWADREIKVFVPSEYSVLVLDGPQQGQFGPPSLIASGLPADVEELVLGKDWECQTGSCYTAFTTDDARAFAVALDAAGFDESVDADHGLAYTASSAPTQVVLRPRLPHEVAAGPIPG